MPLVSVISCSLNGVSVPVLKSCNVTLLSLELVWDIPELVMEANVVFNVIEDPAVGVCVASSPATISVGTAVKYGTLE